MFDSAERLHGDVSRILGSLRSLAEGRYAALFDVNGLLLENPSGGEAGEWTLRRFLEARTAALLRLPVSLHAGEEMDDLFEDWSADEFFLAFVNCKVGLVIACPDAKRVEDESGELLRVLVDRLLRLNPAWRLDEKGRGLFVARPRLDTIVVARPSE